MIQYDEGTVIVRAGQWSPLGPLASVFGFCKFAGRTYNG